MTSRTVLLIEQNDAERRLHAEMLRFVGFRVLESAGVDEGARRARTEHPDLIVLDVPSPEEGWRRLRRLRQQGPSEPVPVAVIVAAPLPGGMREAARLCGEVERPVRPFRLVQEAERCLGPLDESLRNRERLRALRPPRSRPG